MPPSFSLPIYFISALVPLHVGNSWHPQNGFPLLSPLPAVRNTMVLLEQQGLIRSPHTSAGRIPTTSGIRLFIDKMLQLQPLTSMWNNELQRRLTPQLPVSLLCQQAGQLLTNLTGFVAIVSAPKADGRIVRQIDLVRLASDRLLLVVIDEDGDILHRVLHCDAEQSPTALPAKNPYIPAS